MSDVVISVENLSKRYLVGHNTAQSEHRADFRELVSRNVSSLARKTRDMLSGRPLVQGDAVEEFWALNDVSFEVKQGERLGIIGRNGAGKSTLLKILSRITEPTQGRVRISGRVASLLEIGTGFHPDLTGRENIFLNGAILGMRKRDIQRRFDEIVSFAEVERFLDTPVKRYSSGMYVRLAFAVAAHLEPEILIVDEVLAVGDAQFQRKCLNLLQSKPSSERTVLFVSHSMASVKNLCNRAICLDRGHMFHDGRTEKVIESYLALGADIASSALSLRTDRSGNSAIRLLSFEVCDPFSGQPIACVPSGQSCIFKIRYQTSPNIRHTSTLNFGIGIDDPCGNRISHLSNEISGQSLHTNAKESGSIEVTVRDIPLIPGNYSVTLFATIAGDIADWIKDAGIFCIAESDFFDTGKLPVVGQGTLYLHHSFTNTVTRE